MYYAAYNHYGSPTSNGFANTEIVRAFDTKEERDAFVEEKSINNKTARAIRRDEVTSTLWDYPKPFSGRCYAVIRDWSDESDESPSMRVEVVFVDDPFIIRRFYGQN
jgi:hypothetical protein